MSLPTAPRFQSRKLINRLLPPLYISNVTVIGLFDRIDYPNLQLWSGDNIDRVAVIYGDNGTGKTTILRLLYACLSPEKRSGLRTLIARTPFRQFSIFMSDGSSIDYIKENLVGAYTVKTFIENKNSKFEIAVNEDGVVREQQSVLDLEEAISRFSFELLFVDHNRVVRSTYAFLSDLHEPRRNTIPPWEHYSPQTALEMRRITSPWNETDLQFPLPQIVSAVENWFRSEAFRQRTTGDQNAAAVYLEIAKALGRKKAVTPPSEDVDLINSLSQLAHETESYVKHGLLSAYPFGDLINVYRSSPRYKKNQIQIALSPFLDTVRRQVAALYNVHSVMTTFEKELNKLLSSKKVSFHILNGLSISDGKSVLDLNSLSSGEKQLVFLLSTAVVARSSRSLILVDEPELSLNYKWQRLIAGSLASISSPSNTQFILASHSIEIITKFMRSAVELVA